MNDFNYKISKYITDLENCGFHGEAQYIQIAADTIKKNPYGYCPYKNQTVNYLKDVVIAMMPHQKKGYINSMKGIWAASGAHTLLKEYC